MEKNLEWKKSRNSVLFIYTIVDHICNILSTLIGDGDLLCIGGADLRPPPVRAGPAAIQLVFTFCPITDKRHQMRTLRISNCNQASS